MKGHARTAQNGSPKARDKITNNALSKYKGGIKPLTVFMAPFSLIVSLSQTPLFLGTSETPTHVRLMGHMCTSVQIRFHTISISTESKRMYNKIRIERRTAHEHKQCAHWAHRHRCEEEDYICINQNRLHILNLRAKASTRIK
jgi:hypothetical protein